MSRRDEGFELVSAAEVANRIELLEAELKRVAPEWEQHRERYVHVLTEWMPFAECAVRAESELRALGALQTHHSQPIAEALGSLGVWKEARSMAWLFAHRMGDQEVSILHLTRLLQAWRATCTPEVGQRVYDEVLALLLDGYTQGRVERVKSEVQRSYGENAIVRELFAGTVLVVLAGPLECDAVRLVVDRASRELLKRDARALIVDIEQLQMPTHAVLAELWALLPGARTLGTKVFIAGVQGAVQELMSSARLSDEGEHRCVSLAEALRLLGAKERQRSPVGWLKFWQRKRS